MQKRLVALFGRGPNKTSSVLNIVSGSRSNFDMRSTKLEILPHAHHGLFFRVRLTACPEAIETQIVCSVAQLLSCLVVRNVTCKTRAEVGFLPRNLSALGGDMCSLECTSLQVFYPLGLRSCMQRHSYQGSLHHSICHSHTSIPNHNIQW